MEKEKREMADTNKEINEKKGMRRTLTILGYACVIVFLLAVLPVILPPIFGYHTYLNGTDTTGLISKYGSVVYVKEIDNSAFTDGNIVVVANEKRTVDISYVASNDGSDTLTLKNGSSVSYDQVKGQVVAKTPIIGYLSQLCFSVAGVIVLIVLLAAGVGLMMYVNKISKEINQMVENQRK